MGAANISILVWGAYIILLGIGMLLFPNKVLPLFKYEKPKDQWIHVLGLIVIALGYYYIWFAIHDVREFFIITVWARYAVAAGYLVLIFTRKAQKVLLTTAVVEAGSATWTLLVL